MISLDVEVYSGWALAGNYHSGMTRVLNGDIYAVVGHDSYNMWHGQYPGMVFVSHDDGATWTLSLEVAMPSGYVSGYGGLHIASDSSGKLHIAWGCRLSPSYSNGEIWYVTGKDGAWGPFQKLYSFAAGASNSQPSVFSMDCDGLNHPHFSAGGRPGASMAYWHFWWDGSAWQYENTTAIAGGKYIIANGDNDLYTYVGQSYVKKPYGGVWGAPVNVGFTVSNICCDKDNNVHFCGSGGQYRKLDSTGVLGPIEVAVPSSAYSIATSQDGEVHIICAQLGYPYTIYSYHRNVATGVWSQEQAWNGGGFQLTWSSMMFSYHPYVIGIHVNMPLTGTDSYGSFGANLAHYRAFNTLPGRINLITVLMAGLPPPFLEIINP